MSLEFNKIYQESNLETMKKMDSESIDVILTSPFYNTNHRAGKDKTLLNTHVKKPSYQYVRYDVFVDKMSNDEYIKYTKELFSGFDKVLKPRGVVLYNINYGADNPFRMFEVLNEVCRDTNFMLADVIVWKKKSALPNSVSPNKLTRIWEFVFVFCKKDHYEDFLMNKEVVSERESGQKQYTVFYNFIEARNNDESCPFNKVTFSTDLCRQLLDMYCPRGG